MTNISQGWQCPVCGRVYSPGTPECTRCGDAERKTESISHKPCIPSVSNGFLAAETADGTERLEMREDGFYITHGKDALGNWIWRKMQA